MQFCRYAGEDWTFSKTYIRAVKPLIIWMFKGQAVRVNIKRILSSNFKLSAGREGFPAFSVCPSSKLQLLQWVPKQWLWNGKLTFFFAFFWKSWEQVFPQKQVSAITLLAKMLNRRNKTSNTLNVFRFPNRSLSPFFCNWAAYSASL